jgi:hypothetical protein
MEVFCDMKFEVPVSTCVMIFYIIFGSQQKDVGGNIM